MRFGLLAMGVLSACCPKEAVTFRPLSPTAPAAEVRSTEPHLATLRQLTFGGENAEAYWSNDGTQLVYQARQVDEGCDQIYRMRLTESPPRPELLSTGDGVTTCAFFTAGDASVLFSSTHLAGSACPPRPDHSQGYVWPLNPALDVFQRSIVAGAESVPLVRLTETPGYDAESTVCARDGAIIFTSARDGDLELYRMDRDGKNVVRLTRAEGYDGGAFWSPDCSRIVWRASRPEGAALDDYRRLLGEHRVRPSKLELWVANADGSDARQVTYLDAASFAPSFFPSGDRLIFSSNYGDPKGREFDIFAVDVDGSNLERVTTTPGFDGFPMFSPDGNSLAFSSNRATLPGKSDTNVFVARWSEGDRVVSPTVPERVRDDVRWLAAKEREGRGVGHAGLEAAARFVETRFAALGLQAAGSEGFRQGFDVVTGVVRQGGDVVAFDSKGLDRSAFSPLAFSGAGKVEGPAVLAGHGVVDAAAGVDDYRGLDVKGRVVVVKRFVPGDRIVSAAARAVHGDLRRKAWLARERGALALVVVDAPDSKEPEEPFPALRADGDGDAGLPVVVVGRAAFTPFYARLTERVPVRATVAVELARTTAKAHNIVARLPANAPLSQRLPGVVLIGAHYDHLGHGGAGSLAPDSHEAHLGADDNASGVAALLEAARALREGANRPRDIVFVAFSAEELGVLGSGHFVKSPLAGLAPSNIVAMLNMDMVGRLRDNRLDVLGGDSAREWPELVAPICAEAHVRCNVAGTGYGPSDHASFFAAGVPVLHFFTGSHSDYHRPSDVAARINAIGIERVASIVVATARLLGARPSQLHYQPAAAAAPIGDVRSTRASLGTVPDYGGPPHGQKGVLLSGVRAGGPAEQAGMRRGDILVGLGPHAIGDVRELMFTLGELRPLDRVKARVLREGNAIELDVTMGRVPQTH